MWGLPAHVITVPAYQGFVFGTPEGQAWQHQMLLHQCDLVVLMDELTHGWWA